jgi:hypothetical protein
MWPWSNIGAGLGGTKRYERRIELPIDYDFLKNHKPQEGVIVVGAIINDDFFRVLGQNTSALIFDASTNALWLGVTTSRRTVVVEGSAVLKLRYWNTTLRPKWDPVRIGIAHQRWQDLVCTACDPMISRIQVQTYLQDEPDDNGVFLVQVQVHGAPVPGFHLLPAVCRFTTNPGTGEVEHSYFLGSGIYDVRTQIFPVYHYGRPFPFPDYSGIFYADPVGTQTDGDGWTHVRAHIIALPQITNQCGPPSSSGGNWAPEECNIQVTPCPPCSDPRWLCSYYFSFGRWNLAYDFCGVSCSCSHSQEELTKVFCDVNRRLPQVGDYVYLPCCSGRS